MILLSFLISFISLFNLTEQGASRKSCEQKSVAALTSVLYDSQKFVKAHAAEYLIWLGHSEVALKEFIKEEKLYSTEPKYRIVIWRVLVQAESDPERKKLWLDKIYAAYQDLDGPDRTHATETLAKLRQPVAVLFPEATTSAIRSADRNLKVYGMWANSIGDTKTEKNSQIFLDLALTDTNTTIRKIAAFILRQSKGLNSQQWDRLVSSTLSNQPTDDFYVTFLATSLVTAPVEADHGKLNRITELLIKDVKGYTVGQRTEVAQALAERGSGSHLKMLRKILNNKSSTGKYDPASDEGADLRAAVAYAILKIKSRRNN